MIRVQDIADMAGVSRTTVSNVIKGNTKKVSQKTIDKITKILEEQNYVPSMTAQDSTGHVSRIIGLVTYYRIHGMRAAQDAFVGTLLGVIEAEVRKRGYYLMLISGETSKEVVSIASSWNMDGLILLGYSEEEYKKLKKKLNKKMILIDTYAKEEYSFQNVGVDDYDGGYQVGKYLCECGYKDAIMLSEFNKGSDYYRWKGFQAGMEAGGSVCDDSRHVIIGENPKARLIQYEKRLPQLLKAGALAFSSDYNAIEAMSILVDLGVKIPEDISIVGFDDSIYASVVRPALTTVRQDIEEKGKIVVERLTRMINGEKLSEMCVRNTVQLIKRASVKE